mmetsp:Transcript_9453/g.13177  ORF Transcript_9453/g.13177 Transcript_9453/m.13177 type:complete len:223 (-) Transcript_9453:136-804(-)|eukprot:CAMPEP_0184494586 /NCGR_PEP_ID=MMETSP0113_2-20130426/29083_1 /TAXON_ID=91329 /ORGANISM="Norrisiella sphaerica, Strain BC52" /LENGTH=222 /DNA_ID=CAMNT_0026880403 /DNA_START=56 /DNA_END=724 /DNA_ORIENTATION=+
MNDRFASRSISGPSKPREMLEVLDVQADLSTADSCTSPDAASPVSPAIGSYGFGQNNFSPALRNGTFPTGYRSKEFSHHRHEPSTTASRNSTVQRATSSARRNVGLSQPRIRWGSSAETNDRQVQICKSILDIDEDESTIISKEVLGKVYSCTSEFNADCKRFIMEYLDTYTDAWKRKNLKMDIFDKFGHLRYFYDGVVTSFGSPCHIVIQFYPIPFDSHSF